MKLYLPRILERRMGKIDFNKKQKREALLNTAFDLFSSKGINETSISDIVNKAGVAKGTFYLYFRDKYDIRNFLISHKASHVFGTALEALEKTDIENVEDKIIFMIDQIIKQLAQDKFLLTFISKNLSWGFFKTALIEKRNDDDIDFLNIYTKMLHESNKNFVDPEIMLFMIIELISSTCYSAILYEEPVSLDKLKPYLYKEVRHIIQSHEQ